MTTGSTSGNATITGTKTGSVTEDNNVQNGNLVAAGTLIVSDPDPNEGSFRAETITTGKYGTFQLATSGNWTYTALNSGVQSLAQGQTDTDTFSVQSADGTFSSVTITLNGTNDAPVAVASSTTINQNHAVTGQLTETDVDTLDTHTYAVAGQPTHGTVTVSSAGVYTYTPTASFTGTDTFTFTTTDNNNAVSAPATITVNVTPDHAPVATASTLAATEDTQASGTVTATDQDNDALTYALGTQAAHGTVVVNANGTYTYTPNANYNGTDSFTFTANDGTLASQPATVNVTVAAVNDAPMAQPGTLAAMEGVTTPYTGRVTATDVDTDPANNPNPDHLTYQINTPVAGLIFNSDGTYSLNANDAGYDHLAAGAVQHIVANYSVTDSAGASSNSTLTIDVTGTNDAAVVTGTLTGTVTEDAMGTTVTRMLTVADPDDNQSTFVAQTTAGTYGNFVLTPGVDANGQPTNTATYVYTLDNTNPATNALGAGDVKTETFTIHTADNTAQTVTITVNGSNDAPTVSGPVTLSGGNAVYYGASNADNANSDFSATPDLTGYTSDTTVTGLNGATPSATGTITVDHAGTYIPGDAAAARLYVNGSVNPGGGSINGPTLTSNTFTAATGDVVHVVYNLINTNDYATGSGYLVNTADGTRTTLFNYASNGNAIGTSVATSTGATTIDVSVPAAGSYQLVFQVGSYDQSQGTALGATLEIGQAYVGRAASGISEDVAFSTANGRAQLIANAHDVDTNDNGLVTVAAFTTSSTHGATVTLDANGNLTIDASKAADAQALAKGETLADSFTYTVADGHGGTVTSTANFTLVGANDAPVGIAATAVATENSTTRTTGTLTSTDVDHNHTATYALTGTIPAGLTLGANGNYSFNPNLTAYDHIAAGQVQNVVANYTVTDDQGATGTSTLTIAVTGVNDAATVTNTTQAPAITEDAVTTTTSGQLTSVDKDDGETGLFQAATVAGRYGSLTIDASGAYTYTLANANTATNALGAGDHVTDALVVKTFDGTSYTINVGVNGANDNPTVTGSVALAGGNDSVTGSAPFTGVSENAPATYTDGGAQLVSVARDVDANDSGKAHVVAFSTHSAHGATVALDANGNLTIDNSTSDSTVQALGAGQTLADSFTYTIADAHGGTVTNTANFTVIGDNDAPTLSAQSLGPITDTAVSDRFAAITGTSTVTDPDQTDTTFTFSASSGGVNVTQNVAPTDTAHALSTNAADYGSFAIDAATGAYTFTPTSTTINALHAGDHVSIAYQVTATDAGGLSSSASYTVSIDGADDNPIVTSEMTNATEGGAVVTGTVAANDTDVDGGALAYTVQVGTGVPAGLTLFSNGSYSFDPTNSTYDSLAQGQTTDAVLHYQVSDGNGGTGFGTLTIHVTGTNDAPTITGTSLGTINDTAGVDTGMAITLSGTIATGDVDVNDTHTISVVGNATSPYGTLVITDPTTGAYTFTGNQAAINALAATDNPTVTYAVQVADNNGLTAQANFTIALHGTNDTPVITSAPQSASLTESDAALTASGAVTATDAEGGALTSSVTASVISSDAQLTSVQQTALLNDFTYTASTGAWTYDTVNSPDFLPAGSTTTLTYTVGYTEATGTTPLSASQNVVITLHGTNDAPVVTAGAPALSVTEGSGVITDSVHPAGFPSTDADNGDTLTYAATGALPTGVTLNSATGAFSINTSDAAYTHLAAGAHQDLTINFSVSDGHGGLTAGTDTIEITGVNNAVATPTFVGGAPTVAEDAANGTAVGTVNAVDPDDGSSVSYSLVNPDGRFAIDAASGTITVANGVAIDYEQAPLIAGTANHGYGIDILATSSDGSTSMLHSNVVVTDVANEVVIGTPAGETVVGGAGDDSFTMNGGNDTITGGGGHDIINGGDGYDTAVFNFNLSDATIVRTGLYSMTVTHGSDVATLTSIEDLKFADGNVNLVSANPLVDNLFYDQHNYDVYLAGLDPTAHYLQYGEKEGRDPDLAFSTKGYLAANPDLSTSINLLTEFTTQGSQQGRDPSAGFDTKLYLLHNPDVAAAGIEPLAHYVTFGQFENRATYGAIGNTIMANGFDSEYYLLSNPDVAAAGINPYQHYLQYGAAEGRNPNAWFDDKGYLAANPDVAAAGVNPLVHYDTYGWQEGRDPSAAFDTKAYLAANPDVANAHIDPLVHFLQFGAYELRDPHSDGMISGPTMHVAP